jgi:hypothetical protein
MVSIYDKNFRAFPLTGEKIEALQCKKMKFRNAGYADIQKSDQYFYFQQKKVCLILLFKTFNITNVDLENNF